jgi:hypothetical protein
MAQQTRAVEKHFSRKKALGQTVNQTQNENKLFKRQGSFNKNKAGNSLSYQVPETFL